MLGIARSSVRSVISWANLRVARAKLQEYLILAFPALYQFSKHRPGSLVALTFINMWPRYIRTYSGRIISMIVPQLIGIVQECLNWCHFWWSQTLGLQSQKWSQSDLFENAQRQLKARYDPCYRIASALTTHTQAHLGACLHTRAHARIRSVFEKSQFSLCVPHPVGDQSIEGHAPAACCWGVRRGSRVYCS